VEFTLFLIVLGIVLPLSVTAVLIAKIWRNNAILDPVIIKKLDTHRRLYTEQLEKEKRSLQNKLNGMQKGPTIEGSTDDMGGLITSLLPQVTKHLPNWIAKPLTQLSPAILKDGIPKLLEYAEKNPEQAQAILSKFLKPKTGPAQLEEDNMSRL